MDNSVLNISINGSIGPENAFSESYSFDKFKKALALRPEAKTIYVNISSNGGDVFTGYDIGNLIKSERATGKKFIAVIGSRAASIATYIAVCCDEIQAHANSLWLIHYPRNEGAGGTADDMQKHVDTLRTMGAEFVKQYQAKSGQSPEAIDALMKSDKFIPATEARDLGYINKIIETVNADIDQEFKAVATYNLKDTNMADNKETAKGLFAELKKFFQADAVGMVTVDGDVKVGSTVTVDGAPAPDGPHKLADGTEIIVKDGKIESLTAPAAKEDTAALTAKIAELEAQLATANADKESATAKATELESKLIASVAKATENEAAIAGLKTKFETMEAALKKELPVASYKNIFGGDTSKDFKGAAGAKDDSETERVKGFLERLERK